MSEKPSYKNLSIAELSQDVSFIRWVQTGQPEDEVFSALAVKADQTIIEAAKLVEAMRFKTEQPEEQVLERIHESIEAKLAGPVAQKRSLQPVWWRYAAAAVLAGLLGLSIWAYSPKIYQTGAGEQMTIALPDGSQVELNGNSSLRTPRFWQANKLRRVQVRGEAFFDIQSVNEAFSKAFEVSAGSTRIRVLGTRFNVRRYGNATTVVLNEGRIEIEDQRQSERVIEALEPGQMASLKEGTAMSLHAVDTTRFTSWHQGYYTLEDTPLQYLLDILHDNYGQSVELVDATDATRLLTGRLPAGNLEELLQSIELVLDMQIVRDQKKILFQ